MYKNRIPASQNHGRPISQEDNRSSIGGPQAKSTEAKASAIQTPSISMPKGGGAIKGIGETFTADAFTGTANYSITIPITPARDFEPQISLDYNSGGGNGIFGMGFSLAIPNISLRTERGIPRYNGKDIYMNQGAELVPKKTDQHANQQGWNLFEYLPRVQQVFSLIQHLVKEDGSESYWKITTNENTVSFYGRSNASRIYNPDNPTQIFEWLIEQSTDAKGNKIIYNYKAENNDNVPDEPWEKNRSYNNKYIQNIQYGNYIDKHGKEQFAYQVVFDYGEYVLPGYEPVNKWKYRADAFSSYASGFEIRTCRLCYNIMLFHFFEDELGDPCLVKNVHCDYRQTSSYQDINHPGLSLMSKTTLAGYKRSGKKSSDNYEVLQAPPVEFSYSEFNQPQAPVFKKMEINDGNIPGFLNDSGFQPIDLNSEGIAGLLYNDASSIYYCSPEGEGQYDIPMFPLHFPTDRDFSNGDISFTDLDGNGELDVMIRASQRNGYYLKNTAGAWQPYAPFKTYPTNISDPQMELVDLSNNGKTDAMWVGKSHIHVYPSLGINGYDAPVIVKKQADFPSAKKNYLKEYIGFTSMMGDGLAHRVKISAGSVECWPDMGYGVFGKKITMGNAPWLGNDFDISRLLLADIDGSGTTDIIYIEQDKVSVYINHCGNYFSDAITVELPESYSNTDQVSFADINGNGTNCLVYMKSGPVLQHYYYDFTGETTIDGQTKRVMKPYLLTEVDNNMGSAHQLQYCSAIKFYLEDKKTGNPWCTRLPFPVQVVEKVIVIDKINKTSYSSSFKFHDGFYDHAERQFMGFGFVESWDAAELSMPPVYTRTWYRTGAGFENPGIMANYKAHFFQGDPNAYDFPDVVFDPAIYSQDSDTLRQAYVALKGQVIRAEVYADDQPSHPGLYKNPYTVSQANSKVTLYQEKDDRPFAVFLAVPRESISYDYERNPLDPRVQQNFTITTDAFGNPLQTCNVCLQRRPGNDPYFVAYPEQLTIKGTLTLQQYVDALQGFLFCSIPCEEQHLELSALQPDVNWYFSFDGIKNQIATIGLPSRSKIIPYGESFTSGVQARQINWNRQYFWNWNDPNQHPTLGVITSPALLHHNEEAVFTKEFTVDVFKNRLIDDAAYLDNGYLSNVIYTHGGYFYNPGNGYWWNKGLIQYYLPPPTAENKRSAEFTRSNTTLRTPPTAPDGSQFFYLPNKTENSFGLVSPAQDPSLIESTTVEYDDYYLFPIKLTQQIDSYTTNTVYAQIDYVTALMKQLIDINNNTTQVLYDPLGQVIVSSIFGMEAGAGIGAMTLYDNGAIKAQYQYPGAGSFNEVISNPQKFLQGAHTYFFYNVNAWIESKQPVCSINLTRNFYWNSPDANNNPYCQVLINYSDGLGRDIEKKMNAGAIIIQAGNVISEQWRTTGRTVYNSKGLPCEVYLPFFSFYPRYEDQRNVPGPAPRVTHYDPLSREIRIDTPKGFFSKIEFTAWEELHFDEDDTILDSYFYKNEYPGNLTPNEIDAIVKAAKFYNTPSINVLDNKGIIFLKITNNLGNVRKDAFKSLEHLPLISSEGIWQNLYDNGYLLADANYPQLNFLTAKFQPYIKGFTLNLDPKYKNILQQIIDILKENCLTSYYSTDISGKVVESIDPRIYYNDIINNQANYNFRYRYPMIGDDPVFIDSIDAGTEMHLFNIFNSQLWTWSPRSYCQLVLYDRLQRKTALTVKQIVTPDPVSGYADFNLVEILTYGEAHAGPPGYNLRGQVYQVNDLSGIVLNTSYTMLSQPLQTSRQMLVDYKTPANWRLPPLLESTVYKTAFTYNAVKQMLTQAAPDDSVTSNTYDQAGQLKTVSVKFPGNAPVQSIIDNIEYDANAQKTLLKNGNGITTTYMYEVTTLRLTAMKSNRYANSSATLVQDIEYYYDPVGNITRTLDNTVEIIFHKNQCVDPLVDYTYNAIYQLITATGHQHIGIAANTYQDNSPDSFKQCIFGPPPFVADSNKLENYTDNYTYDDSGNLTNIKHTASSGTSWSRDLSVVATSNRLLNGDYDASGNLRKLDISNNVDLAFNCCENLVRAGIIIRLNQPDDCDYYMYDIGDMRTRKVSEKLALGGTLTVVEDKIYLGNFEVKRNIHVASGGKHSVVAERQTLRIMDNERCICIIYYTPLDSVHPEMQELRQCRFQMDNNIGSVCMEMDTAAQLISYEEYFPYGGTSIITGENETEVKQKVYRYSGKECDDSTGLYYYGRRYYVSWQGRWLNPDPAGTVDGMNLYAFTNGNPIAFYDEWGMMKRAREEEEENYLDATKKAPDQNKKPKGSDFTSEARFRKSYFKKPPTTAQSERFFTEKSSVLAILKFNAREILFTTNTAPADKLEFPHTGLFNQNGQKIGAHSEDWITAGFSNLMQGNEYAKVASTLPADQIDRHVASLKINFSPCTGCVRTLVNFNDYLKKTFGDKTIFRVKFLRPYDLPITLKNTESQQSKTFLSTLDELKNKGIVVRLHPDKDKTYTSDEFSRAAVKTHAPKHIDDLTKRWRDLKVARKKAA